MSQDNILDPAALLASIEAKIAALQALSASLRAAVSIGALGPITGMPAVGTANGLTDLGPIDLPTNPFIGMSVPAAIKLYLSSIRKKQTIKQIAAALRDGGIETTSSKFENVVTGSLNRLKNDGLVLRFKEGFAWAALYPEHIRSRITKEPAKSTKGQRRKRGRPRKNKEEEPKPNESTAVKQQKKVFDRMWEALAGKELSAAEVASAVGIKPNVAAFLLPKLVSIKWAEKTASGKYRAVVKAA